MLGERKGLRAAAFLVVIGPLLAAIALYGLESEISAVELPGYGAAPMVVRRRNDKVGKWLERIGEGSVLGPENFAYNAEEGALYTGCADGWIKKVAVASGDGGRPPAVTNFSYVGGRPLGLAFTPQKELIVCDSPQGLLKVREGGSVEVLADEAGGMKVGMADGVDVAKDGTIYFTDATYKYRVEDHMLDLFEGRPHGRLISFNPITKSTQVLMEGLYFPNGVAVSPAGDFLVFCETPVARCQKYYIEGEQKGTSEMFIDNLPGLPDNIRYDGNGHFWIALVANRNLLLDTLMRSPSLRKALLIVLKFMKLPEGQSNSGLLAVNLKGEAIALYSDSALDKVTVGLQIGDYLYFGFLESHYMARVDIKTHAAHPI
ncbi:protein STRICTOSIDINE SYNTHASE-LIKE 6-like [Nymphaea colorata]|nr:protein STRICTOSIDINE SYNTHASE-LIKE 6-like [Nymphaea colorata]